MAAVERLHVRYVAARAKALARERGEPVDGAQPENRASPRGGVARSLPLGEIAAVGAMALAVLGAGAAWLILSKRRA